MLQNTSYMDGDNAEACSYRVYAVFKTCIMGAHTVQYPMINQGSLGGIYVNMPQMFTADGTCMDHRDMYS